MYNYVVVFTYSFDSDSAAYIFKDFEEAVSFLRDFYKEKIRIDKENGWKTVSEISEDGRYAKITNIFCDCEDVTEVRLSPIYQ